MKQLSSAEVRQLFLDFFKEKGILSNLVHHLCQIMIRQFFGLTVV